MGFGLCALGFGVFLFDSLGLSFVGYALISYGFFGVARALGDYKGYKVAAYVAAAGCPFALIGLYRTVAYFTGLLPDPDVLKLIQGVPLCVVNTVLAFAYSNPTARIAADGGANLFSVRARLTAYITALYTALKLSNLFQPSSGVLAAVVLFGEYVVILLNVWLLFTCFTTITTVSRYEKEQEIIARQTEELVRKRILKGEQKGWKRKKGSEDAESGEGEA